LPFPHWFLRFASPTTSCSKAAYSVPWFRES
jgi:hypothetical protein